MMTIDRAVLADVVGGLYKPSVRVGGSTIYNPFGERPLPGQPPVLINRPLPRPTPF